MNGPASQAEIIRTKIAGEPDAEATGLFWVAAYFVDLAYGGLKMAAGGTAPALWSLIQGFMRCWRADLRLLSGKSRQWNIWLAWSVILTGSISVGRRCTRRTALACTRSVCFAPRLSQRCFRKALRTTHSARSAAAHRHPVTETASSPLSRKKP